MHWGSHQPNVQVQILFSFTGSMRRLASVKYLLCENAVWWLVITKASRAESISTHSRRPVALLLPLPERERKKKRERERERERDD